MFKRLSEYNGLSNVNPSGDLVYDNPLFKVRLMGNTDNKLSPKPKEAEDIRDNDAADKFSVGDRVMGKEIKSDDSYEGEIMSITKNSLGEGMILVILDTNETKRKIDATTATKVEAPHDNSLNLNQMR